MSDKFVFLRQFYVNLRKVTSTTVVLYFLKLDRGNSLSVSIKVKKINFGNFVLPNKILPPPPFNFESGYARALNTIWTCLRECNVFISKPGGWGEVLPYIGYMGMCRSKGYGFQAIYSRIGSSNHRKLV